MGRAGWWMRLKGSIIGAVIALLVLAVWAPRAAEAQSFSVVVCGKVEARQVTAGSQLVYSQCGDRFTTAQPYVAVIVELTNVRGRTVVAVELQDPEQNAVWTFTQAIAPPEGQDIIYRKVWYWGVLPLGAEPRALIAADPSLLFHLLTPTGKPVRERLGEWTFRLSLNNGAPGVRKFTLQAAPGAPTPGPTPTPAPAPTAEPTPAP